LACVPGLAELSEITVRLDAEQEILLVLEALRTGRSSVLIFDVEYTPTLGTCEAPRKLESGAHVEAQGVAAVPTRIDCVPNSSGEVFEFVAQQSGSYRFKTDMGDLSNFDVTGISLYFEDACEDDAVCVSSTGTMSAELVKDLARGESVWIAAGAQVSIVDLLLPRNFELTVDQLPILSDCANSTLLGSQLPVHLTQAHSKGDARTVFSFKPPRAGLYQLDARRAELTVFEGESCDGQILAHTTSETAIVRLTSAATLLLEGSEAFALAVQTHEQRATCSQPAPLMLRERIRGATIGAQNQVDPLCAGRGAPEAVYRFKAPERAIYHFIVEDDSQPYMDPVLSILDGETCAGDVLACNDDNVVEGDEEFARRSARASVVLQRGQTVLVVVDGAEKSAGDFQLYVYSDDEAPCCKPTRGAGCDDDEHIEACVCHVDANCCTASWDEACVGLVDGLGCGECR
jgi:hypothetical protein